MAHLTLIMLALHYFVRAIAPLISWTRVKRNVHACYAEPGHHLRGNLCRMPRAATRGQPSRQYLVKLMENPPGGGSDAELTAGCWREPMNRCNSVTVPLKPDPARHMTTPPRG